MKVLVQRVNQASVTVGGEVAGRIGLGLVGLVGVAQGDSEEDVRYLVDKTIGLRIFPDEAGKFNRSLADVGGSLLLVSQFTLISDTRKGKRPSFIDAAGPAEAEALFNRFVDLARATGIKVETGRFQAHMMVEIHNDGPVTIMLDSHSR